MTKHDPVILVTASEENQWLHFGPKHGPLESPTDRASAPRKSALSRSRCRTTGLKMPCCASRLITTGKPKKRKKCSDRLVRTGQSARWLAIRTPSSRHWPEGRETD